MISAPFFALALGSQVFVTVVEEVPTFDPAAEPRSASCREASKPA